MNYKRRVGKHARNSHKNRYKIVVMLSEGHTVVARRSNGGGFYSGTPETAQKHLMQAATIYVNKLVAVVDTATNSQIGNALMLSNVTIVPVVGGKDDQT